MAVILSPRGNEASNMMKRFVRYEEAAQYFGIDETLIVAYAKAAGAVYQLSKIRLIKIEPLEDYMKHLTKVGRSSKLIQRKFVRVGEGTLIYNIGRNRFIEMARAAGAVYKMQINGLRNSIRLFFLERRVRMGVVQKKFSSLHYLMAFSSIKEDITRSGATDRK